MGTHSNNAEASRLAAIQEEQGMAWRLFNSLTGIDGPSPTLDELTDDELLELAWEERGAFADQSADPERTRIAQGGQ